MQNLNYKNFYIGAFISLTIAVILFVLSAYFGKINFFLLLNTDLGICADYFFGIITNAGDALMWIAVVCIILLMKRKSLLPLIICAFIFTTIFTQVCKYWIVPDELRPWKAISNHSLIHKVFFVDPWLISSFPSGHTATAFTFYLLFCLILQKKTWLWCGLFYAFIVAYSRIYLAQHFPFDLAGGIIAAIASVSLSLVVMRLIKKG